MSISFLTARTGLIAQQQGLNIYANNIANVNTVGFKPLRPSFAECIYTLQTPDGGQPRREQFQTGHGQYVMKTDFMWSESSFVASDQPLDFALPNDGFFMTLDRNGNTFLTRDGAFGISFTGENWELVNGFGDFVLDYDMNRITVPFEVDANGNVTVDIDYGEVERMIGVFSVDNNWGLEQSANNRFIVTDRSGAAVANPELDKVRCALEMSATDIAGDMVRIIETQRSYQLNARVLRISDELMTTINNLR
ncbi:MAG: flagellar hook-basal body protein [Oscillospiraceae bacterium]|nr:flagellar hook-basal body protein [Oscillospiraceae bacterium]